MMLETDGRLDLTQARPAILCIALYIRGFYRRGIVMIRCLQTCVAGGTLNQVGREAGSRHSPVLARGFCRFASLMR